MGKSYSKWECSAISRSGTKQVVSGRDSFHHHRSDCDFLLFSASAMAMDRLAALRVFSFLLSFKDLRAHLLSKAQRQPDPAQDSYELNPTQQTTNYVNNQSSSYGNDAGNGTSDNFYDEVYPRVSPIPHKVSPLTGDPIT